LPPLDHEKFLRRSFEVARGARGSGNHPFGAILVDAAGAVLLVLSCSRVARDLLASKGCDMGCSVGLLNSAEGATPSRLAHSIFISRTVAYRRMDRRYS
jgi:hypothetical protein